MNTSKHQNYGLFVEGNQLGHRGSDPIDRPKSDSRDQSNETRAVHYQTGRGTLCSLDNDASIRTHTQDKTTVTCSYCQNLLKL